MAKYGKWLGAGLGFVTGGPLGALLGLFIGSLFDNVKTVTIDPNAPHAGSTPGSTGRGDFMFSLLVLATAMMKADGRIMRSELDYVKAFLKRNFGLEATQEATGMIKKLNETSIPLREVCMQIRYNMDPAARTQLLYFLVEIAKADGNVCTEEIRLLEQIAENRKCIQKGGQLDYSKAANIILEEFRNGKIGKITLEMPPAQEQ